MRLQMRPRPGEALDRDGKPPPRHLSGRLVDGRGNLGRPRAEFGRAGKPGAELVSIGRPIEQRQPARTLLGREAVEQRERALYPPFGRLASLIVSAGDRPTAEGFARKLAAMAPRDEQIQVLGPAEAPLAVIKGRYRFRLLVKSARGVDLSGYLREWLAIGPKTKGNLKLEVDVDPQSFL